MPGQEQPKQGFEIAFQLVGGHGRFQWICLLAANIPFLMMTWNHMGGIFLGAVPQHWCNVDMLAPEFTNWTIEQVKNISIPKITNLTESPVLYDQCNYYDIDYTHLLEESHQNFETAYALVHDRGSMYLLNIKPCDKWSYDNSVYKSTIVTEFDLVCQKIYLVGSIQALYMVGALTGTLVFGPLNDKLLGRRKASLLAIILVLVGGFTASFSISYWMFIGARFLAAMGTAGTMQAFSVWFMEHCDTKSRGKFSCLSGIFFSVGYAILPIFAYFIRDWSNLQLAFSMTTLSLLSFFWLLPESPRWLASHGKEKEAVKALLSIARINGMPEPNSEELLQCVRSCFTTQHDDNDFLKEEDQIVPLNSLHIGESVASPARAMNSQASTSKVVQFATSFLSLLSTKELRRTSFTVWFMFLSVSFIYYGLAFSTSSMIPGADIYLAVSLGALMEIPGNLIPIPFISRWGRRHILLGCCLLTGLSSGGIAVTPEDYIKVRTALSLIGKLFVSAAFTLLYLVVNEAYPTVVRSTGQGAATLVGRIGAIVAPIVADSLARTLPSFAPVTFGIVAVIASLISLFLPEMRNIDMKDQISSSL